MKTVLITGGASGLGKGIALDLLKNGNRVIVVGNSIENGNSFCDEEKKLGMEDRAVFIQANLSLVKENQRLINVIKEQFSSLDIMIFCAARHNKKYAETAEGFEATFALAYLSRFVLSYGLKEQLEKTDTPTILNICGTGMKGEVNWDDLQFKYSFAPMKVMMHGSRLNDLLGVEFSKNDNVGKIKYILYNPMAVITPGMMEFGNSFLKLIYKIIGKSVEKATLPISELLTNPPTLNLSAFREKKSLALSLPTYNKENAKRLYEISNKLLNFVTPGFKNDR
jgi:hypothetical protein